MTLEDRIKEAEQNFENSKADMYRFQGEYRALTSLRDEENTEDAAIVAQSEEGEK